MVVSGPQTGRFISFRWLKISAGSANPQKTFFLLHVPGVDFLFLLENSESFPLKDSKLLCGREALHFLPSFLDKTCKNAVIQRLDKS